MKTGRRPEHSSGTTHHSLVADDESVGLHPGGHHHFCAFNADDAEESRVADLRVRKVVHLEHDLLRDLVRQEDGRVRRAESRAVRSAVGDQVSRILKDAEKLGECCRRRPGRLTAYLLQHVKHADVLPGDDGPRPQATGGVVRALVLVHAPVAGPLGSDAVPAGDVPAAVVVREVPADEVLVRLGRAHGERDEDVVRVVRDGRPADDAGRRAGEADGSNDGIYRFRGAEHAPVLGSRRQFRKRADSELYLKRQENGRGASIKVPGAIFPRDVLKYFNPLFAISQRGEDELRSGKRERRGGGLSEFTN